MAKLGVQTDIALARLAMDYVLIPPTSGCAFRSNRSGWLSLTSPFQEDRGCCRFSWSFEWRSVSGTDLAKSRSML